MLVRMGRKGETHAPMAGVQIGATAMENGVEGLQKIKNRTTM